MDADYTYPHQIKKVDISRCYWVNQRERVFISHTLYHTPPVYSFFWPKSPTCATVTIFLVIFSMKQEKQCSNSLDWRAWTSRECSCAERSGTRGIMDLNKIIVRSKNEQIQLVLTLVTYLGKHKWLELNMGIYRSSMDCNQEWGCFNHLKRFPHTFL